MILSRIINAVVIIFSLVIIISFFLPWAHGKGSVAKPIEDVSNQVLKVDPTGVAKTSVKISKGIIDKVTSIGTGVKLEKTLSGFEIALSEDKDIKKMRPLIYGLYVFPVSAFIFVVLSLVKSECKGRDIFVFIIAIALFVLLFSQIPQFSKKTLFKEIKVMLGFRLTMYSFLAIAFFALIKSWLPKRTQSSCSCLDPV